MEHKQLAFAYFNCAANYFRQAAYAHAIQCYLAGLRMDQTRVEVYADLAKAYEMLGCWAEALEALEVALRLRPGYPTALRRRQRILEEKAVYDTLIGGLNLDLDPPDTLSPTRDTADRLKIERTFFTLTYVETIPQKLISILCQLVEHTHGQVGQILGCYPQHRVPISLEVARNDANQDLSASVGRASEPIPPLPLWAAACYDGGIRLAYRPYGGDSAIGILYSVIRHEWVHLLVDALARGRCPRWLDEGLAGVIARPPLNTEKAALHRAIQDGQLLPLHKLHQPFDQMEPAQRRLAYIQARAIADCLVQQFGFSHIRNLLIQIGNGKPFEAAVKAIFGKPEMEVVAIWRNGWK